jgi:hypothetical protein
MGIFDILGGDGKKKPSSGSNNSNNNPLANAFANIGGGAKNKGFKGTGKSLGGSKPGKVLAISLPNPGPLGLQVRIAHLGF